MSPKENLHRLIDQLPEDKAEELERVVVQMLRGDADWGQPKAGLNWEEAAEHVFDTHGELLRNLAK